MIFDVSHKTFYRYEQQVVHSQHMTHLVPRDMPGQSVRHHGLFVEPAPATRIEAVDYFGNGVAILDIDAPHRELVLHARSTVETHERPAVDFESGLPWERIDDALLRGPDGRDLDTIQYRCSSRFTPASPDIADFASTSFKPGRSILACAMDLTLRIFNEFDFDSHATDISTPITTVLRKRRGVCQDFAHLALAALRTRHLPVRYVSGYILTHPPPGEAILKGADASHAWISVWSPDVGWVDFDPTNGIRVGVEHVTLAYGRDYNDVAPISGVLLGGGPHTVSVAVDMARVPEK